MSLCEVPEGYEIRMRIVKALKEEFSTNTFESISVTSICKRAGIARQTFYSYFKDKYDIIDWYEMFFHQESVLQVGRSLTWFEGQLKLHNLLFEERDFFSMAVKPRRDFNSLPKYATRLCLSEWRTTLVDYIHMDVTPTLEYQMRFWSKAGTEAGITWINEGFPVSPEEFTSFLNTCIPRELFEVMNNHMLTQRSGALSVPNKE